MESNYDSSMSFNLQQTQDAAKDMNDKDVGSVQESPQLKEQCIDLRRYIKEVELMCAVGLKANFVNQSVHFR